MKNRVLAAILSVCILTSVPASRNEVSAASKQLNLQTTFGTSATTLYGVPTAFTTRYTQFSRKVSVFYKANFDINLNFYKPTTNYVIQSSADECRATSGNGNFDSLCQHVSNQYCNNNGPYHCTNCWEIKRDVFSAENSNYIQLHITATALCTMKNNLHGGTYGVHFPGTNNSINDNCIIVRDYDYVELTNNPLGNSSDIDRVCKTLAHEIGHLYDIEDHYSSVTDGNPFCIWGYYKDTEEVRSKLLLCDECKATIIANANRYNHS